MFVELVPFIANLGPDVFDAARTYLEEDCPDMIYSPAQFSADWDRHVDALCALIPPIEYIEGDAPQASSLTSILNVGWAALLTRLDDVGGGPAVENGALAASRMERLNELLLKAVELSEARRLWDEHQ